MWSEPTDLDPSDQMFLAATAGCLALSCWAWYMLVSMNSNALVHASEAIASWFPCVAVQALAHSIATFAVDGTKLSIAS